VLSALAAICSQVSGHLVMVYPGWRGDNLKDSGKLPDGSIPQDGLGVGLSNDSLTYPYGMQWIYPCTYTSHQYFGTSLLIRTRWWNAYKPEQNEMGY
jgi:hypothetical protein